MHNKEILFEAPNCIRVNDDILFQVSNTGNVKGAQWLQSILGEQYRVHLCKDLYSYAHLDSTIIPIREGLVVYNASRVNEDNEPELFKSWDKIWIDECYSSSRKTNLPWGASAWIGLNLLSVNPNLVIVDRKQEQLIEKLNQHKISTIDARIKPLYDPAANNDLALTGFFVTFPCTSAAKLLLRDFFIRQFKENARPFPKQDEEFPAFSEGRYLIYDEINDELIPLTQVVLHSDIDLHTMDV